MFGHNTTDVDGLTAESCGASAPDTGAGAVGEFGYGVDDLLLVLALLLGLSCFCLDMGREFDIRRRCLRWLRER